MSRDTPSLLFGQVLEQLRRDNPVLLRRVAPADAWQVAHGSLVVTLFFG